MILMYYFPICLYFLESRRIYWSTGFISYFFIFYSFIKLQKITISIRIFDITSLILFIWKRLINSTSGSKDSTRAASFPHKSPHNLPFTKIHPNNLTTSLEYPADLKMNPNNYSKKQKNRKNKHQTDI